ncbi:MAG TPA: vWA domain-containing protein, partial [Candidatus Polarisedimenticolaceae bacterium]|nr:vWA domain-containing protein [Candidatus Polarisedimenticolaceae bacterium]
MTGLYLVCATLLAVATSIAAAETDCAPAGASPLPTGVTPRVEIVFALDATGSMSGLIEGAKDKVWSIVNAVARARPAPEVVVGMLVYRDRGDEYVTRRTPLDADLDRGYAWLIDQQAAGGGDGPESVRQALHEAVAQFNWSTTPGGLRLIFLVGDAPPHDDYHDDVTLSESIALATERGIRINTIQCGGWAETTGVWKAIADASGGDYFQVEQSGGMVARATPFDAELARHARLFDETIVPYGTPDEAPPSVDDEASAEALAERAAFKLSPAGESGLVARGDLVRQVLDGAIDVSKVDRDLLPEPLGSLSDDELRDYLAMLAERRRGLREELEWLTAQRNDALAARPSGD